jgi:hypothetical protein
MIKAAMTTALPNTLNSATAVGLSFPSTLLPELGVVVGVEMFVTDEPGVEEVFVTDEPGVEEMFVTDEPGVGVVMVGDHDPHAVANTRADCVQVVGLHW